jgi:heptosyltransferase-2
VSGSFIVLAPGARWGTKRWPYFPQLASSLDSPCVVIGATEDVSLGATIVAAVRTPGRVHSAAGALTLRESAAVIERASLVITNDSVALHLASALGRPIIALFGPTVPRFGFGPIGEDERVIEHPTLPCRPCSAHGPEVCPLGHHHCMRDIEVAQVLAAVTQRLQAIR